MIEFRVKSFNKKTTHLLNNIILKDTKLKLMDLHRESDKSTIIAGDFMVSLSETDREEEPK